MPHLRLSGLLYLQGETWSFPFIPFKVWHILLKIFSSGESVLFKVLTFLSMVKLSSQPSLMWNLLWFEGYLFTVCGVHSSFLKIGQVDPYCLLYLRLWAGPIHPCQHLTSSSWLYPLTLSCFFGIGIPTVIFLSWLWVSSLGFGLDLPSSLYSSIFFRTTSVNIQKTYNVCVCVCVLASQSCPTLQLHGQRSLARILEWHYQRNANQNHNEVPLHASQDGCSPKVYKQ